MNYFNRKGDWVETYSGKRVYLLDPQLEDIDIVDIAWSSSLSVRFTGQCCRLYTWGQHSIIASYICKKYPFEALMHDSSEAFISDISSPLKRTMELQAYKEIEHRMMKVIACKYNFQWPEPKEVKEIDLLMLSSEKKRLFPYSKETWQVEQDFKALGPEYNEYFKYWPPKKTFQEFMLRFVELRWEKN